MKEDIEAYAPEDGAVVAVEGHLVTVDVGDASVPVGHAIRVNGAVGRVSEQLGNRQVEVQFLGNPTISVGDEAEILGDPVRIALPAEGSTTLNSLHYTVGEGASFIVTPPAFMDILTTFERIPSGNAIVDAVAPLGRGAVNMIVDGSTDSSVFRESAARAAEALPAAVKIEVGYDPAAGGVSIKVSEPWEHLTALRIGLAWAAAYRDAGREVLFIAELPPVENSIELGRSKQQGRSTLGGLVDLMGAALTSSHAAPVTAFLRFVVDEPTLALAETMTLGKVDVQWVVDAEGSVDVSRSTSIVEVDADAMGRRESIISTLARAAALADRFAIFGDDELSDADRQILRDAEEIRESLSR